MPVLLFRIPHSLHQLKKHSSASGLFRLCMRNLLEP